jgi:hypothetical protein
MRRSDAAQRYAERNHRRNVVAFARPCRRATLMVQAARPLCEAGKAHTCEIDCWRSEFHGANLGGTSLPVSGLLAAALYWGTNRAVAA